MAAPTMDRLTETDNQNCHLENEREWIWTRFLILFHRSNGNLNDTTVIHSSLFIIHSAETGDGGQAMLVPTGAAYGVSRASRSRSAWERRR